MLSRFSKEEANQDDVEKLDQSTSFPIEKLPQALLWQIFLLLRERELTRLAQVKKQFNTLSSQDVLWKPLFFQQFELTRYKLPVKFQDYKNYYAVFYLEKKKLIQYIFEHSISETTEDKYKAAENLFKAILSLGTNYLTRDMLNSISDLPSIEYEKINDHGRISLECLVWSIIGIIRLDYQNILEFLLANNPLLSQLHYSAGNGFYDLPHIAIAAQNYDIARMLMVDEISLDFTESNFLDKYETESRFITPPFLRELFLAINNLTKPKDEAKLAATKKFIEELLEKGANPNLSCTINLIEQNPIQLCNTLLHKRNLNTYKIYFLKSKPWEKNI